MKIWRPDSIGATIAMTIITAMILGFAMRQAVNTGLMYLGLSPHNNAANPNMGLYAEQLPGRIAAEIEAIDSTPDSDRAAILDASQRMKIQSKILAAPAPTLVPKGEPDTGVLRHRIAVQLKKQRFLIVGDIYPQGHQPDSNFGGKPPHSMFVEAQLSDGQWLVITTSLNIPTEYDPVAKQFARASFATWLGFSILLANLLAILTSRRLVTPLSKLASAVEHTGGAGDAPPLPLFGPREIQTTIAAFNRMQERLRRFNNDRTQMLAAMSHDLRTPVTRLKLWLEFVEDTEQRQKMLDELNGMMAMIDSTLTFARDDSNSEARTLVDLSALVENICEDASDAGADVSFSGPAGVTLSCRPIALRRAISNLVDNAIKYGGSAKVRLSVDDKDVLIEIEDQGPGIPRGEWDKVFEPFYRLDASRNAETGGVGLGLAVARSITRELGGDIILANRKGGGLIVRIRLPL